MGFATLRQLRVKPGESVWSFERKTYNLIITQSSHSMKSGGFHMDFMKSAGFQVKSGRFHTDFMGEIRQISG